MNPVQEQPVKAKNEYRHRYHHLQKELMTRWYQELDERSRDGRPTAALMISGNCVELLRAFDIEPIYPEINALQLAIHKQSLPYLLKAEEMGYSTDNCGYVKADVGLFLQDSVLPSGTRVPKPSLLLCNFVGCNTYIKWFEHLAYLRKIPLFMLDVPFLRTETPTEADMTYVLGQFRELIAVLENLTKKRFDPDRFREIVRYSQQAGQLWADVKRLSQHRPSPYDAYFDSTVMMGPLYVYRGTPEAVHFFQEVKAELEERLQKGKEEAQTERFRIVVEGPPPYPYFKNFRDLFSSWGVCAVASTYSTVGGIWEFGFSHDPDKPLESMARHMLEHNVCNRSMQERYRQIQRYLTEWHADALVIHSVKSCRLFSCGQGDMREHFIKDLQVPTLFLESDLEDPRYFAQAQMKNRIDAFFESLEHRKTTHKTVDSQPSAVKS